MSHLDHLDNASWIPTAPPRDLNEELFELYGHDTLRHTESVVVRFTPEELYVAAFDSS